MIVKIRFTTGLEKQYKCDDVQVGKHRYWLNLSSGIRKQFSIDEVEHLAVMKEYK